MAQHRKKQPTCITSMVQHMWDVIQCSPVLVLADSIRHWFGLVCLPLVGLVCFDCNQVDYAHHGVAGYDAATAVPLDLKLVEDKGPRGFVFQTLPADPTRRGIYGHFNPPCNVT